MGKYLGIAVLSFKTQLVYKWDVLMKGLFAIIRIYLSFALWSVIFLGKTEISGMTLPMMVSYHIISSYFKILDCSDSITNQLSRDIREGTFIKYKVRPMSVLCYFVWNSLAKTAFNLVVNIPAVCLWIIIFHKYVVVRVSLEIIVGAVIISILGLLFMILLNFLVGILSFQFIDISAANMIKNIIVEFLIGMLVPLVLLPDMVKGVMQWFPFYYITYLPSMLLLGKNLDEVPRAVITVSVWLVVLFIINQLTFKLLQRKDEGVGM